MTQATDYPIMRSSDIAALVGVANRLAQIGGAEQTDAFVSTAFSPGRIADYCAVFGGGLEQVAIGDTVGLSYPRSAASGVIRLLESAGVGVRGSWRESAVVDLSAAFVRVAPELTGVTCELACDDADAAFVAGFLSMVGDDRAMVSWDFPGWPSVSELSLAPQRREAGAVLILNATNIHMNVAADTSVLYVTVASGPGEPDRARWLAGQVGMQLIGPAEAA